MIPSKRQRSKAGTILFLLFVFMLFAYQALAYSPDKFSPPDKTGDSKIPHFGNARIPVLIISGNDEAIRAALRRPFFSNDLEANTFRNYWHANSLSAYDTRLILFEPDAGAAKKPLPECGQPVSETCREEWLSLISNTLHGLAEADVFEAASFDIDGRGETPDGVFDGIIVLTDGVQGVYPLFPDKNSFPPIGDVRLGPTLLAGFDASNYELLRGFAILLGFSEMRDDGSNAGIRMSLVGSPEPGMDEAGFPMIDGYSRLRAGWARPVKLNYPVRKVYLLPARTSGEVYIIGEDTEFFLIENRSPGGGYDTQIKNAGLAIYHIDESQRGKDGFGYRMMNLRPDADASTRSPKIRGADIVLFRDDSYIRSDYQSQNPVMGNTHPPNTNWFNGEPSDVTISDIDTKSYSPLISAAAGLE